MCWNITCVLVKENNSIILCACHLISTLNDSGKKAYKGAIIKNS